MRLTVVLLIVSLMQVSAATFAQRVTLNEQQASLKKVFKEIRRQSGFDFYYDGSTVSDGLQVTVAVKDATVEEAMKAVTANLPLTYEIKNNTVIVKKKEEKSILDKVKDFFQAMDVTGKVVDEQGQPLPGATVKLKDGSQATTTDARGEFTLRQVQPDATLVVSFIGFQQLEVKAAANMGNIVMKVAESQLDQVQVIAYGTTTKRFQTGNVTTVTAKEIEQQPVNNPLLALQGRVPGLVDNQATGFANGGVKVQIQGQNSINNGNDPFYVIDGVPYISQLLPNYGNILGDSRSTIAPGANGNPLSFINPADIESIEILKDADATAIYGSRAANGAILITTKKGKAGETKVDFNLQNGWGKVARKMDLMNTQQYLEMRREALKNDGITTPPANAYDLNGTWDNSKYTDWQKELIGGTANYTDLQTSVSGGSDRTQFLVGVGYHRETTVFPGDFGDSKGSIHFNINNASKNQKFKMQFSGSYMLDNNQLLDHDLTYDAVYMAPVAPSMYNADGTINWFPDAKGATTFRGNPAQFISNKYHNRTSNLISNVVLNYEILPGLNVKSSFGYTYLQSNETKIFPLSALRPERQLTFPRSGNYSNNNINSWVAEPQIFFNRNIGNGHLEILLGTTIQQNESNGLQILGYGQSSDLLLEDLKSAPNLKVESSTNRTYKYNAIFSRINYRLSDRYILNFTGRRDGSSRFGYENRFHNFGALGAAWIFSEEPLLKSTSSFLSIGKFRASYGLTGSDQITDYRYLNLYESVSPEVPYQGAGGLGSNALPNPYLQWEETKKLEFGLDLGFIKDHILINVNYFRNRSSNQLMSYVLPLITGVSSIDRNFPATLQNGGWEISLNTINIKTKKISWTSSINYTSYKNKLVDFPGIESSAYASRYIIGEPITFQRKIKFCGSKSRNWLVSISKTRWNFD